MINRIPLNPEVGYVLVTPTDSSIVLWTTRGVQASHGTVVSIDPKTECGARVGSHILFDKYSTLEVNGESLKLVHIDQIYGTVDDET